MAHECPNCGINCHCGGDIDDICFDQPTHYCTHCEGDEEDEESGLWCSNCGWLEQEEDHAPNCPQKNQFYD